MSEPIIRCHNLSKSYSEGPLQLEVLKAIDLTIQAGERLAIVGPSGSGKSTLLQLLGGLDKPSSGQVFIAGQDWQSLTEAQRCKTRNHKLGFIYQFHHLLPEFTALENSSLPLLLAGVPVARARDRARLILEQVGLGARISHKPAELSGGERQRVAIARALVQKPSCVFADEPTGNLDQQTAHKVFERMLQLNQESNTALVIVTHDLSLASKMDRVLQLQAGCLQSA